MSIDDIFTLDQYDEAYAFVVNHPGTTIKDLGNGSYEIEKIPEPSIADLKFAKREEINSARDAAEQGGFEYKGRIFDSDQISAQRISMAAQAMVNAPAEQTITWTCQDNTTIDLNGEQLQGLVIALASWSNECHKKATELKSKIDVATSKEELDKIVWEQNNGL